MPTPPSPTHPDGTLCRSCGLRRGGAATPRPVTDRQLEILTNVAHGRTNRQIGEKLGISEKTVRNHLRTISHKLNSSDRTHSVVLAIGNGWIPIPIQPDTPSEVREAEPQTDGQVREGDAESVVPSRMKTSTAGAD